MLSRLENLYVLRLFIKLLLITIFTTKTFAFYKIIKNTVAILIFNFSTSFTFFIIMSVFTLIIWLPSERLLTRFDNELDINLVLSKKIWYVRYISKILVTSFSIGTVNVMYCSVFSPKQANCFLKLLLTLKQLNSFMIKW